METGEHLFIVPLCHEHNELEKSIYVLGNRLKECTDVERQGELIELNTNKYEKLSDDKRPNKVTFNSQKKMDTNRKSLIDVKRNKRRQIRNS